MQLKTYQQNALDQLDRWLDALDEAHLKVNETRRELGDEKFEKIAETLNNYPLSAWEALKKQNALPVVTKDGETKVPDYISRTATSGEPIPHVCMKIPTGGGKTLLGVEALKRLQPDKGFVLWIVPSKAIYEQTIKSFRNREHPYRQILERISGGRVKLLEKNDRFTKQDVESYLCVMMLMFPSANRQKGKEFLKIFRDSGGYTSFFPEQDDFQANKRLTDEFNDLETNKSSNCIKQSLINVLKLIRPTVVLDEAHKAYGRRNKDDVNKQFVKPINRLNPRFVLELSATPKIRISNILVDISGTELKKEEMIKLPIEIHSLQNSDWKHALAETQKKLDELARDARKLQSQQNRYVRPIALVRVQRTGKDQREQNKIHSEDVREYLIKNLKVQQEQIRVQSSEKKELAGENLLDEQSPVRWIITKDALKEGWDCSFAYILALLDNTTATTAITQMVGRVMRQPHARRIEESKALNQCYIYCYNREVGDTVEGVKKGLEMEGLTGLGSEILGGGGSESPTSVTVKRRGKYKGLKIFLPQVLHKEGKKWRPIDYDQDILSAIPWNKLAVKKTIDLSDEVANQHEIIRHDLDGEGESPTEVLNTDDDLDLNLDFFVRRLVDVVPNPWQAARIADKFLQKHKRNGADEVKLFNNRIDLSEELRRDIRNQIEKRAEEAFREKVTQGEIKVHLETNEQLNYELNKSFEVHVSNNEHLQAERGGPVQGSLFEPVYKADFNNLEQDFALYLEESKAFHWWHRIAAARQEYFLQGWRRERVYPDFIACKQGEGKLLILETKGKHLKGNDDTKYKEALMNRLEEAYKKSRYCGDLKIKEPEASFRIMNEESWREDMNELIKNE